ncbi:titin-like [Chironomus tepperi]|uniref:titin-like n=1 Tax=Chironomus tepperi TaxID=113505 RepID=UPI00391F674F
MGNLLCRDKSPRRIYVKGPVKGTTAYDPQLFSNDSLLNGTRKDVTSKNSNNKMFFSTPNLKSDMKSTISLDARIFDRGNSTDPPVAPPRTKRTTLKKGATLPTSFGHDVVPNGFKEVFGTSISSRVDDEIDFIDKDEDLVQERSTPEGKLKVDQGTDEGKLQNDQAEGKLKVDRGTSTPGGKLKIDKGTATPESKPMLDQRSSTPTDPQSDHHDHPHVSPILISKVDHKTDEQLQDDPKHISDKNLSSFLMNMLDDIRNAEDEAKYKDQIPVEEPPFIVRRRETKHICDDDDHIHSHTTHRHDHDHPPPKPDRDFTKSAIPIDVEVIEVPNIQPKVLVKRVISRDSLPSPPATPTRKKGIADSPAITIEADKSVGHENQPQVITTDIVDMVISKAYGMSDFNYHPEDFSHDDGSNLVKPTSKLAVRKISTPRKISTESAPTFDNDMINVEISKTSTAVPTESVVVEKVDKPVIDVASDVIDEIYNKNSDIIQEFQTFLEQSIEKEPIINVDDEKKYLESRGSLDESIDDQSYSDSFESTDDEVNVSKIDVKVKSNSTKRRESIEDVDNWFSHHIEMEQKESEVCNPYMGERSSIGYDTNKIFPFGSTITGRRDSQSDEFFTDPSTISQRLKLSIEPAQAIPDSILEEDETKKEPKVEASISKQPAQAMCQDETKKEPKAEMSINPQPDQTVESAQANQGSILEAKKEPKPEIDQQPEQATVDETKKEPKPETSINQAVEPPQAVQDETKQEQKVATGKRESSPDHSTLLKFLDKESAHT